MSITSEVQEATAKQPVKDLYEIGEIPPLGHTPDKMYAWAIRRERHGEPDKAHAGRGRADPEGSCR